MPQTPDPVVRPARTPLQLRHSPWAAEQTSPEMARLLDRHERVGLNNRFVEIDGMPAIPVSGEIHFSRVPRAQWLERLRLMKAGGITVVATYVFWLHHEPTRGQARFDGNRDLAAFIALCASLELLVVVRIGPWCHGEVRNGGFPDWVQAAEVAHRSDDPGYLALVDDWFAILGAQLAPLCGPRSAVIGLQIENEIYDQSGHISTLKAMARRHGMTAPLYTATAWGGAQLPVGEVLPLYGGYGDGFWVDADAPWDDSFRAHYFFSHEWDDPGIGADIRAQQSGAGAIGEARLPSALFPAATCELGGGMATAYHRRPLPAAADIAAVALTKLGNGSAWQGYYMYAGGVNPAGPGGTQESQATGYPNDLPRFDYDFHAPIGAAGELAPSHAALRRQHAFLAAFGAQLAPMPSSLPAQLPAGVDDEQTLRWALRSDGTSGFLFISWQQPHRPLAPYRGAQFRLELEHETLTLPRVPVDIPVGTLAHWPVNTTIDGVRLRWATASLLTVLDGDGDSAGPRVCVLAAEPGIGVELALDDGTLLLHGGQECALTGGTILLQSDEPTLYSLRREGARLDLLVLPAALAAEAWVLDTAAGRALVLSPEPLWVDEHGGLAGRAGQQPAVRRFEVRRGCFTDVAMAAGAIPDGELQDGELQAGEPEFRLLRAATAVPAGYGARANRAAAPGQDRIDAAAARWELRLPAPGTAERRTLRVEWAGDVAVLSVDGVPVLDRFWDGSAWIIDVDALPQPADGRYLLQILPLHSAAPIALPDAAERRRAAAGGSLLALDALTLQATTVWSELR